jgi:hypothetical protein
MATTTIKTRTRSRDNQVVEEGTSTDLRRGQSRQQTIDQFVTRDTQEESLPELRQFRNLSGFSPLPTNQAPFYTPQTWTPKEDQEKSNQDQDLDDIYSNARKTPSGPGSYTGKDEDYLIDETVDPEEQE